MATSADGRAAPAGTEAVCIGKTINNTMVLLHGKTGPAALDVLIRTPSKELSGAPRAFRRSRRNGHPPRVIACR